MGNLKSSGQGGHLETQWEDPNLIFLVVLQSDSEKYFVDSVSRQKTTNNLVVSYHIILHNQCIYQMVFYNA